MTDPPLPSPEPGRPRPGRLEGPQPGPPAPARLVSDADRATVVRQIQQAAAGDQIPFEDLDDRFEQVYRASTRGELDAVVADLPMPPPPVPAIGHPAPATTFSLLGDTRIGGWIDVDDDLTAVSMLGDITIDLSTARLPPEVRVKTWSLLGDVTVIVPDGVRASLQAMTLLGDRTQDLVPALDGMPTVRVSTWQALGDSSLLSLSRVPEGWLRRLWRALGGTGHQ